VESGEDNAAAGGLWVIMYGRSTPAPAGSPSTLDSWLAEPEPRRTGVAKQCTAGRPLLAGLGWAGAGSCGQRARGIGLFFWLKAWRGGALHQHVLVLVPRTHSQRCWFRGCGQRRQPAAEPASYPVIQQLCIQQQHGDGGDGVGAGRPTVRARPNSRSHPPRPHSCRVVRSSSSQLTAHSSPPVAPSLCAAPDSSAFFPSALDARARRRFRMGYRAGNSLWVERHTQTKLAGGTATGNGSQSSVDTTSNAPPRSPPRSKLSPHRQHLTQLRPPLHTLLCVGVSAYSTCRRRFCLPVSLQSSLLAVSTQQIAPPAPVRGSRIADRAPCNTPLPY
jgi:hypothetical protein